MRHIYKILIFTLLAFCGTNSFAQSTFTIEGTIVSGEGKESVPYAQVALLKPGEKTPIGGGTSNFDGKFKIQAAEGTYDILISFVGYKDKKLEKVEVNKNISLGTIGISENVRMVEEVVIQAEQIRNPIQTTMEGLEVKPEQTISNVGGSLLDVLRNTPSVRVSDDGTISIRGSSNTNILIDGRNSSLAADLEQIPASAIETIQIINNPNAKYDAQAAGGVLNIKLKKGENTGSNASAEVTYGTRNRLNSAIRAGHSSKNFRIAGGYSFRRWPRVSDGFSLRETYDNNEILEQRNTGTSADQEHTFNLSTTFYLGKKNKFSYEGVFNMEDETDTQLNRTRVNEITTGASITQYIRQTEEIEDNITYDNAFIYERKFDQEGREFRALVSSSVRNADERQLINVYNGFFDFEGALQPNNLQRSFDDGRRKTDIIQVDYAQPLFDGKLETGYKSIFRSFDNDFLYEVRNEGNMEYEERSPTNRFLYEDQVHAGYLIYSREFNKLNVSLGVRAEQTIVDTQLFDTNETNRQEYLNFFPSFQTSYKANEANTFKFTFSRRIDRPRGRWLNPFRDVSDSLNVRVGDPNLQPEFINSYEVGHMLTKEKFSLTTNAFYRRVNGQVDWIVRVEDGISIRGPQNLNRMDTYGFELIGTWDIASWWSINASYSFFQMDVDGSNLNDSFTNSGSSWYAKFNSDFNLPLGIDLQITGNYTAPEIEAQGRDLARYYLDVSLQRTFLEDKLQASLSFRDIFDTRDFRGENFGENFRQEFRWNRETQIVLATVRYRIGKKDERGSRGSRGRGRG